MWNDRRSLLLSMIFTVLLALGLLGLLLFAPWISKGLIRTSLSLGPQHFNYLLYSMYTGCVAAALLVASLFLLLRNISKKVVFAAQNVAYLRRISWCCFAGGGICALSCMYYLPWGAVGLCALFVGIIVRVVKNVFVEAIKIKEENDYTI